MKALLTKGFLSRDAIERSPLTWYYRTVPSKNGFEVDTTGWSFSKERLLKSALWIGLYLKIGFFEMCILDRSLSKDRLFEVGTLDRSLSKDRLFEVGTMDSLKSALWTGFQGTVF